MPVAARTACVLLGLMAAAGCGPVGSGRETGAPESSHLSTPPTPGASLPAQLAGPEVGLMAEHELEAEHPDLAPGRVRCPDLTFVVGASVRCLRIAMLSEGRVVKISGTVTVTSRASGGRLHVALDDQAEQFGLAGDYVAADVRKRYLELYDAQPTAVRCPYLPGKVGTTITCRVDADNGARAVRVLVTDVDAAEYRTTYTIGAGGTGS